MTQVTLNSLITSSKVLLFAGAGASAPLEFAPMAAFMDSLEERVESEEQELLTNIYNHYTLEDGSPGRDLEVVLQRLRGYLDFFKLAEDDPNFAEIPLTGASTTLRLAETARNLETRIRRLIFEHYGTAVTADVVSLYRPFLDELRNVFAVTLLPIFTTNYDAAVETFAAEASVPLEMGFPQRIPRSFWDPDRFHTYKPQGADLNLVLFKLHGSVTWYWDGRHVKYVDAAQLNLRNYKNMLIYPGETKVGMLEDPYFTSYTYLRRCLENASHVIVIGYSFRDLILQRVFQEALLSNSDLRFVVIGGPKCESMRDRLAPTLGTNMELVPFNFEPGDSAQYLKRLQELFLLPAEARLEWLGKTKDLVGPGPQAYDPDGRDDALFRLTLEAPRDVQVRRIDVYRIDPSGNQMDQHWTTLEDDATWALGVFDEEQHQRLEELQLKRSQPRSLGLAASDSTEDETWFAPGERYRAVVEFDRGPASTLDVEIP